MQVKEDLWLPRVHSLQKLHYIHKGDYFGKVLFFLAEFLGIPESVEVKARKPSSVIPQHNPVYIEHRNHQPLDAFGR